MPKSNGKFIPTKYKRQYARNAYDSITVFVPKGEKEIIKAMNDEDFMLDDEEDLYESDTKMYHKAFRFKLENIKEVE